MSTFLLFFVVDFNKIRICINYHTLKNLVVMIQRISLFIFCVFLLVNFDLTAQELEFPDMDASPMDAAHYPRRAAFKNYLSEDDPDRSLKIKVLYCRPNKKGRAIFGGLVPYGKEWRLGANEATELALYQAVEIGGVYITPGIYTLFADVYPNQWIIKVSEERFIAGNENRDISKDIVAVSIPTEMVPDVREEFTIGFQKIDEGTVNMVFEWDQTRASLPINLNPATLAGADKSPMDLVQFPNNSRFRNYVKAEELEDAVAKVRVVYSRPQKNGRKIFGELVKYGEMWRVGANETTEVSLFQDATIGGEKVKKGRYGLFAKVNEDSWDFVLHSNLPSWGVPNHDESTNVATFRVKTEKTPKTIEAMSILLKENGDNQVDLIVAWEDTMARLPIVFE